MITQTSMTLFHEIWDEDADMEDYTKQYFQEVSLQKDIIVSMTNNGLNHANTLKIRIPTCDNIEIKSGDKVVFGEYEQKIPPKGAHTVVQFADNRKGSPKMWHWKVVCV